MTLTLEGGPLSFSGGYGGESPAGSGLLHSGDMDGDSLLGLSFEYGIRSFAGPTIAFVGMDSVGSSGLDGLKVDIDPSSPALGIHAGVNVGLGFQRRWMIGIVARVLRTDIDFTVRQPLLTPLREPFDDEEDLAFIGLRLGRRFGP
jgi:hypothetical protein